MDMVFGFLCTMVYAGTAVFIVCTFIALCYATLFYTTLKHLPIVQELMR